MRIALLDSTFGSLPFSPRRDGPETIDQSGRNLGNLAIWQGSYQLLADEAFGFGWDAEPDWVRQRADAVVIPSANWLGPGTDLGRLGELIENIDRPTVVLGLGAQAPLGEMPCSVHPSGVAFLRACSVRTPRVLVRGTTTARLCRELGVNNVAVTGCPSLMIEGSADLGRLVRSRWPVAPDRLAFHAFETQDALVDTERHLLRLARSMTGSAIVVQAQAELIDLVLGGQSRMSPEIARRLDRLCQTYFRDLSISESAAWLRSHCYFFDALDAWRRFLRNFAGSVNTRIHGTIISMMAGIPAVCLHHDSRTKELAEAMCIPTLMHADVTRERMTAADIFAHAPFDGARFDENRVRMAREYVAVLLASGIRPAATLLTLAGRS